MTSKRGALVWMDLEMTGLDPERDRILEIASVVTDNELDVIAEGPQLCIYQDEETLVAMDRWNRTTHGASGLLERVHASEITEAEAEERTLAFIRDLVARREAPLCGNTICQDRRFLYKYMPALSDYLHYRSLDVSSVKELAVRWYEGELRQFAKRNTHRALDDIRESIAELRYYRRHLFR